MVLLEIYHHKACEACGWHTAGFEKLKRPTDEPDSGPISMADSFARERERFSAKKTHEFAVAMGIVSSSPDLVARRWDRVVAFQRHWLEEETNPASVSDTPPSTVGEKATTTASDIELAKTEKTVRRCLNDPDGNPTMKYPAVAHAISLSESRVKGLCDEGVLKRSGSRGTVLTTSVIEYLNKHNSP
jgi:hypothetical protein